MKRMKTEPALHVCPTKLLSQCGQQMTKKAHKRYVVRQATVIVMGFFQHLSSHFLLELSQFFVHSSLRGENGVHQL